MRCCNDKQSKLLFMTTMLYIVRLFIANVTARSDKNAMHDVHITIQCIIYRL